MIVSIIFSVLRISTFFRIIDRFLFLQFLQSQVTFFKLLQFLILLTVTIFTISFYFATFIPYVPYIGTFLKLEIILTIFTNFTV